MPLMMRPVQQIVQDWVLLFLWQLRVPPAEKVSAGLIQLLPRHFCPTYAVWGCGGVVNLALSMLEHACIFIVKGSDY